MSTIKRFEDLDIWKESRLLHQMCLPLLKLLNEHSEFRLVEQLRGSSGSAMDNIAEGFERGNRKEFIQFLGYAKGSVGELKSQLYRCSDSSYLSNAEFDNIYSQADKTGKMIFGLLQYLNNAEIRGMRYKGEVKESPQMYEPSEIKDFFILLSGYKMEPEN